MGAQILWLHLHIQSSFHPSLIFIHCQNIPDQWSLTTSISMSTTMSATMPCHHANHNVGHIIGRLINVLYVRHHVRHIVGHQDSRLVGNGSLPSYFLFWSWRNVFICLLFLILWWPINHSAYVQERHMVYEYWVSFSGVGGSSSNMERETAELIQPLVCNINKQKCGLQHWILSRTISPFFFAKHCPDFNV